jgi:hypothetical protein
MTYDEMQLTELYVFATQEAFQMPLLKLPFKCCSSYAVARSHISFSDSKQSDEVDKITCLDTLHCIKGILANLLEYVVCDTENTL